MDFKYSGECKCGSTAIAFSLPIQINCIVPRACDCNFCSSRQIAYISHPDGELLIKSTADLVVKKQGSNQAEFLTCHKCQEVIAVSVKLVEKRIGALNSNILDSDLNLKAAEVVSPKMLRPSEKLARWKALWSAVKLE
jgi:hypothetical protein